MSWLPEILLAGWNLMHACGRPVYPGNANWLEACCLRTDKLYLLCLTNGCFWLHLAHWSSLWIFTLKHDCQWRSLKYSQNVTHVICVRSNCILLTGALTSRVCAWVSALTRHWVCRCEVELALAQLHNCKWAAAASAILMYIWCASSHSMPFQVPQLLIGFIRSDDAISSMWKNIYVLHNCLPCSLWTSNAQWSHTQ